MGFTFLKYRFESLDRLIFCSVCFSWGAVLLIAILLKFIPEIIIAFMLGMTVTGISYRLEEFLKAKKRKFIMRFFLIQLTLTLLGLAIIMGVYL